jgi:uncharacterized coiled-coil protein SlyX
MTSPPQEWSLTAICFVLMLQSFSMSRMISRLQRIVFRLEDMVRDIQRGVSTPET